MLSLNDAGWLGPYISPFIALSYPTETPPNPDSFPDSQYYATGLLDLCFVVTCIAVMAVLRDAFRLCVFEPIASRRLTTLYNARLRRANGNGSHNGHAKANGNGNVVLNGNGNGNGHVAPLSRKERRKIHRSVLRFAEQGWQAVYYTSLWSLGYVGPFQRV